MSRGSCGGGDGGSSGGGMTGTQMTRMMVMVVVVVVVVVVGGGFSKGGGGAAAAAAAAGRGPGPSSNNLLTHAEVLPFGGKPVGRMPTSPEHIPLGECTLSQSRDQLTPTSRTESTVFSLSRSDSLWTADAAAPSRYQAYWFAIHLMTTGGAFLACGVVISGLSFAGHLQKFTSSWAPACCPWADGAGGGVVLNRQQPALKRPLSYYRPPQFNV
ncbi:hypothetical protein CRUP_007171 [Coryphaenoides rupestris]|nr:hypothetical protein CRUP_007171 [Coryphaenoides rupestris]